MYICAKDEGQTKGCLSSTETELAIELDKRYSYKHYLPSCKWVEKVTVEKKITHLG